MTPFANNLKKARMKKGWSQAKAACRIGIARHNLGAYEEGRAEPPLDKLLKIFKTFEITEARFIDDPDYYYETEAGQIIKNFGREAQKVIIDNFYDDIIELVEKRKVNKC